MHSIYFDTPVGWIKLVEEHERLTTIHFMDERDLREDDKSSSFLQDVKSQLQQYFDGTLTEFPFLQSAQQKGTEFQQRVWNELVKIPYGKTISYLELARRLGDEKKIRAAGTANGRNPIPIIIPCHRVIGSDGSLVGYGGGLPNKKWLLEFESGKKQAELF